MTEIKPEPIRALPSPTPQLPDDEHNPTRMGSGDETLNRVNSKVNRTFTDAPAEKRETIVLEDGLPDILKPKEEHSALDYKSILRKRLRIKNEIILFVCEFVGTTMFLFFSFGIATQASDRIDADQAANANAPPDTSALEFSSLGFGFSLAVCAWVFFRITGSLFNPCLTLGLCLLGNFDWVSCIILSVSQYLGAIAAAGLVAGLLPGPPNMRTTLHGGTTINQGFWIEFFSTSLLLFTVYMLAGEKHKGTFLAPVGIGLALFLGELLATKYTGGSLNPARSLGPDVVAGEFEGYCWLYYVAPYFATLVSCAFYRALVYFNYQTVVPDQDADETAAVRQVIRDAFGGVIGAIDSVPAKDFGFVEAPENDNSMTMTDTKLSPSSSRGNFAGPSRSKSSPSEPYQTATGPSRFQMMPQQGHYNQYQQGIDAEETMAESWPAINQGHNGLYKGKQDAYNRPDIYSNPYADAAGRSQSDSNGVNLSRNQSGRPAFGQPI